MNNNLGQKFTVLSLLKFTAPATIMMVFMSMYSMVDGMFVTNFVGTNALSSINIVFPVVSIIMGIAIMLSTGGSAIIAKNMGEGRDVEARENFTLICATGIVIGVAVAILGTIFIKPIVTMMGATQILMEDCINYLLILTLSAPLAVLQMVFQTFFVTAGKPGIGLAITIAGGLTNVLFDYIFIALLGMGVQGAAIATSMGYSVPAIFGLVYFLTNKKGTLYFTKFKFKGKILARASANGSSEMVTNVASAIITFMFNTIMLKFAGEDGVASVTIVLYAQFLLTSVFLGYSIGISPVLSYNYGKRDKARTMWILKNCLGFIIVFSGAALALSLVFANQIVGAFTRPGTAVFDIALGGFYLFSISFAITGFNIFASAMFTAFSDGKTSAIISFLRTFLFQLTALILLPYFFGINGVWLAVPFAELLTLCISYICWKKHKNIYV